MIREFSDVDLIDRLVYLKGLGGLLGLVKTPLCAGIFFVSDTASWIARFLPTYTIFDLKEEEEARFDSVTESTEL